MTHIVCDSSFFEVLHAPYLLPWNASYLDASSEIHSSSYEEQAEESVSLRNYCRHVPS